MDLRSQTSDVADVLRDLQADVIMLQGCTKETLEFLQEQDWLCEGYEVSHKNQMSFQSLVTAGIC